MFSARPAAAERTSLERLRASGASSDPCLIEPGQVAGDLRPEFSSEDARRTGDGRRRAGDGQSVATARSGPRTVNRRHLGSSLAVTESFRPWKGTSAPAARGCRNLPRRLGPARRSAADGRAERRGRRRLACGPTRRCSTDGIQPPGEGRRRRRGRLAVRPPHRADADGSCARSPSLGDPDRRSPMLHGNGNATSSRDRRRRPRRQPERSGIRRGLDHIERRMGTKPHGME